MGNQWLTPVDDAELGGGSSHIEGEQVVVPACRTMVGRSQCPSCRTRFEQADREAHGRIDRDNPTTGNDQEEAAPETNVIQAGLQLTQVLLDTVLHINVGNRRRGAFELAYFGHHLRRDGDPHARCETLNVSTGLPFGSWVGVTVQKGDGNRLYRVR